MESGVTRRCRIARIVVTFVLVSLATTCCVAAPVEHAENNQWLWQTTELELKDADVKTAIDEEGNVYACGRERVRLEREDERENFSIFVRRYNRTTGEATGEIVIAPPVSSDGSYQTVDGRKFVSDCDAAVS